MERLLRSIRIIILFSFMVSMGYACYLVYSARLSDLKQLEITELSKSAKDMASQMEKRLDLPRPITPSSGRISDQNDGLTSEKDNNVGLTSGEEPTGGSGSERGMVAEVKLPGFSVSLPESSSWMTVAKMIALVLITYLGVKAINLVFRKMEMRLLRSRARRI